MKANVEGRSTQLAIGVRTPTAREELLRRVERLRRSSADCPQVPEGRLPIGPQVDNPPYRSEAPAGVADYASMLGRNKLLIAGLTLACAMAGLAVALPQRPMYRAHTSIEVQGPNENFLSMKDLDPGASSSQNSTEAYIETQARILQDDSLMEKAVDRLNLTARPEAVESGWHRAPKTAPTRDEVVRMAARNLTVQASGQSRIIDLYYDATVPRVAADMANAVASALIDQNLEVRSRAIKRLGESLRAELEGLKQNFEQSATELQSYARSTGLMINESQGTTAAEDRLKQVQEELSRAQGDRQAKQAKYQQAITASPESLPEVLDSPTLRDYKSKLTELRRQFADLNTQFLPGYPKVKTLQAQINELDAIFARERLNIVRRLKNEFEAAEAREKLIAQSYASQSRLVSDQAAMAVHYNVLSHEVETNRALYDTMLQKVKEAGIVSAIRASNIRIISPAKVPTSPHSPNPAVNAGMGMVAGLFLAIALVFVKEHTDRTFRRPGDAAAVLNIPEIGAIPSASKLAPPSAAHSILMIGLSAQRRRRGRIELASWQNTTSLLADSFRNTLASLWFQSQNGELPCISVTSAGAGEGKTSLLCNLGIALALTRKRVLLVDGDVRKPRLHVIFGLENDWGLASALAEETPVERYTLGTLARPTEVPSLFVMTAGQGEGHVASMRYHARLRSMMRRLRGEFDAILVDTPPALGFSDARILGRVTDGVVLVVRASETTRDHAAAVVRRFREDGTPVLGTILNSWDPKHFKHAYGAYGYTK